MILNRHFREFIELLERRRVEYLVVGGYAVGLHGFPRYTGELDIFVAISRKNAESLVKVLADFGFSGMELKESDFLDQEIVIEIGREPNKIPILTGIDGVAFETCYQHRVAYQEGGLSIPFIALDDLIANKAASRRAKDKIDLEELKRIQKEKSL